MSSFSYSKLGSSCHLQKNCALTSNNKYILPDDNNYYKRFTPMMYYPGHENGVKNNIIYNISEPEHIKAYKKQNENFNIKPDSPIIQSCQGCKKPN